MRLRRTEFFAVDLSIHFWARRLVTLTVGLVRYHPDDLLSPVVLTAGHIHDWGCDVVTRARRAAERSAVKKRGEEGRKDAERAERKGSGVFSGEPAPIALLSYDRRCRRRVCLPFLVSFLERWTALIDATMVS